MAQGPRKLTVKYAASARATLDAIWRWNAVLYDANHATKYIAFLCSAVEGLPDRLSFGRPVPSLPSLCYIKIQRRRGKHGHIAVYKVVGDVLHILYFFHTAQDWQTRVTEKE